MFVRPGAAAARAKELHERDAKADEQRIRDAKETESTMSAEEKARLLARVSVHLELAKISDSYSRFVPRQFLEQLGKERIVDVALGDQVQREMTVLFSDIRDFTRMSEGMTPN